MENTNELIAKLNTIDGLLEATNLTTDERCYCSAALAEAVKVLMEREE